MSWQTFLRLDKTVSGKIEGSDPEWHNDRIVPKKIAEIRRAKTPSGAESILTRTKVPSVIYKEFRAAIEGCDWKVVQLVIERSTREMVWVYVLKEPEFEDELFTKRGKKPSDYFK